MLICLEELIMNSFDDYNTAKNIIANETGDSSLTEDEKMKKMKEVIIG